MEDKDLNKTPLNEEGAKNQPKEEVNLNSDTQDITSDENQEDIATIETTENSKQPVVESTKESTEEQPEVVAEEEKVETPDESKEEKQEIPSVDLSTLSKDQLLNRLALITEFGEVQDVKDEVNDIKTLLTDIHNAEVDELKSTFLADGGEEKDFKPTNDPIIDRMHYLLNAFRNKRIEQAKQSDLEKEDNLKIKEQIIEAIKELTQNPESLNKTFHSFHELQDKWRATGPVPRSNVKDLYENYHLQVEIFYDYIKINKELRDYDLKKNLEKKEELCVKAEGLIEEKSELKAFSELQELHKEWRETGPVPKEDKEPMWERFKAATTEINKRHQKFYDELRKSQKENLEQKTALCEKVEALNEKGITNPKEWNKVADAILKIQEEWRTIGFAPKKFNNKIYDRFRKACDTFFENKRKFYHDYKGVQDENLAAKKALVEKAESMKDRDDWKEATEAFIQIQKDWKKIGPVPRKHSDAVWKKFREACDYFFERKNKFFHKIDETQETNLTQKKELIEELNNLELSGDSDKDIALLNDIKQKWSDIGHVPFKQKDAIYNEFRNAMNRHFDKLKLEEEEREIVKFESKLEDINHSRNSDNKLYNERNKLYLKLKALESDVAVWENNLGFFSNSKDSESLVKDFKYKIEKAKERILTISRKIKMIDDMD